MADKNKEVAFRRIKGRIIPIRLNKSQKERAKGAAIAASGAVVAAGGGKIYRSVINKAVSFSAKSFLKLEEIARRAGPAQMSFSDLAKINKIKKSADRGFKIGNTLNKASPIIRKGSVALGAGLIGYGTAKYLNNMSEKQKRRINPEVASGVVGAAVVLGPSGYEKLQKAANKTSQMSFEAGTMSRKTILKNLGRFF